MTSMPPPEPRSSTVSPSRNSATAVGLPQPSDASVAACGSSPRCSASYSASPNFASSPTARAAAAAAAFGLTGDTQRRLGVARAEPPRAAHPQSWSSAARSLQVGDRRELLDRVALQREIGPLASLLALHETRVEQLLHVMRDRGLGQAERLDEIADAHGLAARREQVHGAHARGVAERLEQLRGGIRLLRGERRRRKRRAAGNRFEGSAHIDARQYIDGRRYVKRRARPARRQPRRPRGARQPRRLRASARGAPRPAPPSSARGGAALSPRRASASRRASAPGAA